MADPSEIQACVSLDDYEALASRCLPPGVWAYLAGGGADELTLRWNREAFASVRLQGRVLADLSGAHTRLTLFGQPFDYPVLLAPVAHQTLFHPEGELETCRGASAMRAGQIVSMQASVPFEAIASQAAGSVLAASAFGCSVSQAGSFCEMGLPLSVVPAQ